MDLLRKYLVDFEAGLRVAERAREMMSRDSPLNPYQPPPHPIQSLSLWACLCALHNVLPSGAAANCDVAKLHANAGGSHTAATEKLGEIVNLYELAKPHLGGEMRGFSDGKTCTKWLTEWLHSNGLLKSDGDAPKERHPGQSISKNETALQRQERRYQMCIDAGLEMPDTSYGPWPRGITAVAEKEGIKRQSYQEDVGKYIDKLKSKKQA